ncbi:unnamed protein product [Hymenolepis diminuta]|uniref:Uncharacterized protein n=1 Tax=Hymenolepis diminuta TaxID=6216 RepID=A0A564ZCK1_HYMDI|nr:unnamed protein product [Hymenolepis diminuta]
MASAVKFSFPPFLLPLDLFLAVTSPTHPLPPYSRLPTMQLWLLSKSILLSESPKLLTTTNRIAIITVNSNPANAIVLANSQHGRSP